MRQNQLLQCSEFLSLRRRFALNFEHLIITISYEDNTNIHSQFAIGQCFVRDMILQYDGCVAEGCIYQFVICLQIIVIMTDLLRNVKVTH